MILLSLPPAPPLPPPRTPTHQHPQTQTGMCPPEQGLSPASRRGARGNLALGQARLQNGVLGGEDVSDGNVEVGVWVSG